MDQLATLENCYDSDVVVAIAALTKKRLVEIIEKAVAAQKMGGGGEVLKVE